MSRRKRRKPKPTKAKLQDQLRYAERRLQELQKQCEFCRITENFYNEQIAELDERYRVLLNDKSNWKGWLAPKLIPEVQEELDHIRQRKRRKRRELAEKLPDVEYDPLDVDGWASSRFYKHRREDYEKRVEKARSYANRFHNALVAIERKKRQEADRRRTRAELAQARGKSRELGSRVKKRLKLSDSCPYCGGPITNDGHADHIYPVSKGGQSRLENMVHVCAACNIRKGNRTLSAFIADYGLDRPEIEERLRRLGKDF